MILRTQRCAERGGKRRQTAVAAGDRIQERVGCSFSRDAVPLARALVAAEEKQLVRLDRSAQRTSELILFQYLFGGVGRKTVAIEEEVVGIERFIAEELERASVELIGARLRDQIHIGAGVPPITRIVGGCLNLELLNRVRIRDSDPRIDSEVLC